MNLSRARPRPTQPPQGPNASPGEPGRRGVRPFPPIFSPLVRPGLPGARSGSRAAPPCEPAYVAPCSLAIRSLARIRSRARMQSLAGMQSLARTRKWGPVSPPAPTAPSFDPDQPPCSGFGLFSLRRRCFPPSRRGRTRETSAVQRPFLERSFPRSPESETAFRNVSSGALPIGPASLPEGIEPSPARRLSFSRPLRVSAGRPLSRSQLEGLTSPRVAPSE